MIVTHDDLKALRYCNKGTRDFFKRHNLDWSEFIVNGLHETQFIKTGDAMALQLVEFTRGRRNGGQ
jgi:hypothetical protein